MSAMLGWSGKPPTGSNQCEMRKDAIQTPVEGRRVIILYRRKIQCKSPQVGICLAELVKKNQEGQRNWRTVSWGEMVGHEVEQGAKGQTR